MSIYILSFSIALIFSLLSYNKNKPVCKKQTKQVIFAILSAFPLFIIAAFRYGLGNDYFTYARYFEKSLEVNYMEPGFHFVAEAIRSFTTDYVWLFIVCSLIFFFFIYRAIYEQSSNPTLSILIFICAPYFFEFFSGIREMIAVAIFLYSIKYIKSRKIIPYVILILLASSFHNSAISFFPLYFLYNKKIGFKLSSILFLLFLLFRNQIANFIISIMLTTQYEKYIGSRFDIGHFGIVTLLIPLFIFFFSIIFYNTKENGKEDKDYQFYCNLMFIQLLIVLLQDKVPLITRIGWGFGASQIILVPYAISKIESPKNRIYITTMICLLYIIYLYIMRFSGGGGTLLPFKWIFDR